MIVTLGARGLYTRSDADAGTFTPVAPLPRGASVVDTSGAGDAFVGAFAYFLARHASLPRAEAARRAGVVATHSTTRRGTQSSYPRREELAPTLFS